MSEKFLIWLSKKPIQFNGLHTKLKQGQQTFSQNKLLLEHTAMDRFVCGFFAVGQFAVRKKKVSFGKIRLVRFSSVTFFFYGELSYGEKF